MKASPLFVYVLLLFAFSGAKAQDSFSIKSLVYPDTVTQLGSDSAIITVKYTGASQYTGPVRIFFSTSFDPTPAKLDSISSATLNPNDTIVVTGTLSFDSTHFQVGDGIVVVWSSGNSVVAADSVSQAIHVTAPATGIQAPGSNAFFTLYPSPTNDQLEIHLAPQLFCERIRILDIHGKKIQSLPIAKNKTALAIDVSHLPGGVYFIEIWSGNKRHTEKFVKTE